MRTTNEELLKEKISLAEEDSNDLDRIESEKRQFNALQAWSKKPRYQMPDDSNRTLLQYLQGKILI